MFNLKHIKIIILLCTSILFYQEAIAGECYKHLIYDYESGRAGNYPVCQAYHKSLNQFCDEKIPLYRAVVAPGIEKLKMPKWEKVDDFMEYIPIVADAYDVFPEDMLYKALLKALKSGRVTMSLGKLNLDNNGKTENVIRLNGRDVRWLFNSLIVYDKKNNKYDESFDSFTKRGYDAILYDGRVFLITEENWHDISYGYKVQINEPHMYKRSFMVCDYSYNKNINKDDAK